jgi:hypothetical protein
VSATSSETRGVRVADTSTVWRRAGSAPRRASCSTMPLSAASKPMSSRRSASSSTSQRSASTRKLCVAPRWSSRRPGVLTSSVTPLRSRAFSLFFFSPPISEPVTTQ